MILQSNKIQCNKDFSHFTAISQHYCKVVFAGCEYKMDMSNSFLLKLTHVYVIENEYDVYNQTIHF